MIRSARSSCARAAAVGAWVLAAGAFSADAVAQGCRLIDRAEYADHLRAMWRCESVANWTGLLTEGRRFAPPFLTDADWNTFPFSETPGLYLQYELWGNPWRSDDDTDIEYVYLHQLHALSGNRLSAGDIAAAWIPHINRAIWVSNAQARALIAVGVHPPMTAMAQGLCQAALSDRSLMIDAQLTTEFFGALCPGMPDRALSMADLPIRTTSVGYASHAAQFYVVLYSLASQVDQALPPREQAVWLVREARKYIPDSSKSADVIDFVLADALANPDHDDWESTRDKIYERYHYEAATNGFVYRGWNESSVNLACGVMALLYGDLDLARTIRIGTLSGWDSDNGTSTMGGLIGLLRGNVALQEQGWDWVSDHYWASYTRDNMPDYTPDSPGEDTFTLMGQRMLPIIDREVSAAGGLVRLGPGEVAGLWLLPPGGAGDGVSASAALSRSPTHQEMVRSANVQVPATGGTVSWYSSVPGWPDLGYGAGFPMFIRDGAEHDWSGGEFASQYRAYYTTERPDGNPPGVEQTLAVTYSRAVEVHTIRFDGGNFFTSGPNLGGWFQSMWPEVRVNGQWTVPPLSEGGAPAGFAPDPESPFPVIDFILASPVQADGVRISGLPGGGAAFVTCMEIDALSSPVVPAAPAFDLNADGVVDDEDLYEYAASPADLDADGLAGGADARYFAEAVRFAEIGLMAPDRQALIGQASRSAGPGVAHPPFAKRERRPGR